MVTIEKQEKEFQRLFRCAWHIRSHTHTHASTYILSGMCVEAHMHPHCHYALIF